MDTNVVVQRRISCFQDVYYFWHNITCIFLIVPLNLTETVHYFLDLNSHNIQISQANIISELLFIEKLTCVAYVEENYKDDNYLQFHDIRLAWMTKGRQGIYIIQSIMAKASPKWWRIHVHKWPLHVISVVNVVCKSINKAPNGLFMNEIDCSIAGASLMLSEEYTSYIHCTMKKAQVCIIFQVFAIWKSNQSLFVYLH